jgi:hypothetical protein
MIKVRIAPLLKSLGFVHIEGSYYHVYEGERMVYEARVYKRGGSERYVDMFKRIYDSSGDLHHKDIVIQNLCMDAEDSIGMRGFYTHVFDDLAISLHPYSNHEFIIKNTEYLLGLTEKRVEV